MIHLSPGSGDTGRARRSAGDAGRRGRAAGDAGRSIRRLASPILAVALLAAAATSAEAQRPDSAVVLEGLTVTAGRAASAAGGAAAVVAAPDSLRLPAAASLAQALRRLPFVLVRTNSRGEAELSVRGSESRQAAVTLDGVPLTLGWDGRADAALLPLTGAARVTLVRGLGTLLTGPNALGGTVAVDVAASPAGARSAARVEVDGDGGRAASLAASGTSDLAGGRLDVRAGGAWRASDGIALPGGVADPGADDGLRANTDARQASGYAAARWSGARSFASLTVAGSGARRGVAPELHLDEPRLLRLPQADRVFAAASVGTRVGGGGVSATAGLDAARTRMESFASAAFDEVASVERGRDRTLSLRLAGDAGLGGARRIRAAATLADVRHRERIDDAPAARYRQRLWSVGAEGEGSAGAVRWSAGAALDGADTPLSGDKPPLGDLRAWAGRAGATALVSPAVSLHASASSRARFPALRELYSGSLGRFEPNPALRPERLHAAEAGVTVRAGGAELQAVAFHHRLRDAIVRVSVGDRKLQRVNRDEVRGTGVELLAGWRRGLFALTADAAFQRVRVHDPSSAEGSRYAEHQPGVRAGLSLETPGVAGVRAMGRAAYTGRQHCVHPEEERTVAVRGAARADVGVEREWSRGRASFGTLRLSAWLDNATDGAVYDQCGMPQPGRTLRLGVELR